MKIADAEQEQKLLDRQKQTAWILVVYFAFFAFFIFKMIFYAQAVGGFLDENAHVSYVAYLQSAGSLIPDFKAMHILQPTAQTIATSRMNELAGYGHVQAFTDQVNYLGQPPLYYQILRLSGGVQVQGNGVIVDIVRLRAMSMAIAAIALLLIFYIGFSRIKDGPAFHLLYAAICTSVPLLSFDSAGVNNGTLAMLGAAIFLIGLIRFAEHKRGMPTCLLVASGVTISLLSELTAGMVVLLALLLLAAYTAAHERSLKFLLNRAFLFSLPVYLIAAAYFIAVIVQTGSAQPTLLKLNPGQYYASVFYAVPQDRVNMSFLQYARYYADYFLGTWVSIISRVGLPKPEPLYSFSKNALLLLWLLPLPLFALSRRHSRLKPGMRAVLTVYAGVLLTILLQFLRQYYRYCAVSGYPGGYQSNNYLCAIPAFALCIVYLAQILSKRHGLVLPAETGRPVKRAGVNKKDHNREWVAWVFCAVFSGLLIYEDFIYFIIHFHQYIT